jgi:putative selenium metabolism protein SsnA
MSQLLKSATVITLDPPTIERADLRIDGGRIAERGERLESGDGEDVVDLQEKLVMPGMVCAHTHLYSSLARGMPGPPRPPANFREILELIWWRLDRALDEETVYWSAVAGAIEAARAGTTCLFDHHSSPSHIRGSLQIVREAIERVGLRAVLCYEITDRGSLSQRDDAVEENRAFLSAVNNSPDRLFRGLVGAHASFTLSDETLEQISALMSEYEAGLHIHVAEDRCDVEETRARNKIDIIGRLARFSALNRRTILAHGTHLDQTGIELAGSAGVWFAHNPRSNMNNQVGYAPVAGFGDRVVVGTDGIGADMFEELRFAFFKARDSRSELSADSWLRVMANNHRLASESFGIELGSSRPGSAADLIVLDYRSPTPITPENLAWHFLFGLNSASVESVMVNGRFVVKKHEMPFDEHEACEQIQKASRRLWSALREL